MERRGGPFLEKGTWERKAAWDPRYLYSYFALYGDPLMEPERDPFPDAYLERLARRGINGVWIQAVLNTLAPSRQFPEFGKGCDIRLKNLNAMVARAEQFGMRVFLYLNEPRSMPDDFIQRHPDIRGSAYRDLWAMCTSAPAVREWIAGSLEHIFRQAPGQALLHHDVGESHQLLFARRSVGTTRRTPPAAAVRNAPAGMSSRNWCAPSVTACARRAARPK
jgi:hypothetical protein